MARIQKTGSGYYVPGRNGWPGRSPATLKEAQEYDKAMDVPTKQEAADRLADTVEAYLEAMNAGVLHAEMGLRQALTAYRNA